MIAKTKHRIISICFLGIFLPVASLGLELIAYKLLPIEFWVDYEDVSPKESENPIGEATEFCSTAEIKRESHIIWNDILRCDLYDGKGSRFFSSYESSNTNMEKKTLDESVWNYTEKTPLRPATCYLESNITLVLPFGIIKRDKIIGSNFKFINPQ